MWCLQNHSIKSQYVKEISFRHTYEIIYLSYTFWHRFLPTLPKGSDSRTASLLSVHTVLVIYTVVPLIPVQYMPIALYASLHFFEAFSLPTTRFHLRRQSINSFFSFFHILQYQSYHNCLPVIILPTGTIGCYLLF